MSVEKWDILDKNGCPTGHTVIRGSNQLKSGEYHLVVHIWVLSPNGELLIQKRSQSKSIMPGEWAATGGAAISGETSFSAAKRELFEELGIETTEESLLKIDRFIRRNSIIDIYITYSELNAREFVLQSEEVSEVRWVKLDELKSMISNGKFHNYGNDYFTNLFDKIKLFQR